MLGSILALGFFLLDFSCCCCCHSTAAAAAADFAFELFFLVYHVGDGENKNNVVVIFALCHSMCLICCREHLRIYTSL